MAQTPRLFTHAEATAAMPWLHARMLELRERKHERDRALRQLVEISPAMRSNGSAVAGAHLEARIDALTAEMQTLFDEITARGIEVKDIDNGLVDFPALRDHRVVYLCWLISEPEIDFWHELDAGFAGRQPLDPEAL